MADAFERIGLRFDRADAARGVQRIGFFKGVLGRVPVDIFMSDHPHFFEMQRRRRRVADVDGTHLYFISPEDVCITKLLFGRDKDIADLERLFAAQRSLDLAYVREWIAKLPIREDHRLVVDDLERRLIDAD